MKKLLALVLAVLMVVSLFAACKKDEPTTGTTGANGTTGTGNNNTTGTGNNGTSSGNGPAVEIKENTVAVKIGEVTHPMLPEHHIEWILLETKKGFQIKYLEPGEAPEAKFELADDEAVAVYEYCNLHGLWKKEI